MLAAEGRLEGLNSVHVLMNRARGAISGPRSFGSLGLVPFILINY